MTFRLVGILSCAVLFSACGAPSDKLQVSWDESNKAFLASEQVLEDISALSQQREVWLVREGLSLPFHMRGEAAQGVDTGSIMPGTQFDLRVRLDGGDFGDVLARVEVVEALSNMELSLAGRRLRNANSGKCLVARGSANDSAVRQVPCAGYADQVWEERLTATFGHYQFMNSNSDKCLLVRTQGAMARKAVQSTCFNYADQIWARIVYSPQPTHFQLQNQADRGRCLAVIGRNNETQAIIAGCNRNYPDQLWYWY
jgi:hypothetical protein